MSRRRYVTVWSTFYEMMDECENIMELDETISFLIACFRDAIFDICKDNDWDFDDLTCELP